MVESVEACVDAYYHKENDMPRGTKPDGKRNRSELGSSDLDDSSSDIRESLSAIKHQLEKLDLRDRRLADVNELKASVELNNSLIETLKADNASLRIEVNNLKRPTDELQNDNFNVAKELLDLQCRSVRDNIIFHGKTRKTVQELSHYILAERWRRWHFS